MLENSSQLEKLLEKRKKCINGEKEEDNYIFYHKERKFTSKIELEIILNSNPNHRVTLLIDIESTLLFLSVKIADYMEHYPTYSNLEGLRAINFMKKTDKGNVILSIGEGQLIKDYLENGNVIYCDLKTEEFWIKTSINLITNEKKVSFSIDLKIKADMQLMKLKYLLIKIGTNFWIDLTENDIFHFIFLTAKCEILNSKKNMIFDIEELKKTSHLEDCILIFEIVTANDIFDFESEIICNFRINSIEELIFNKLSKLKSNDFGDKFKFLDLREKTFTEFQQSKIFEKEINTIKAIIKEYLSSSSNNESGNIYFYNSSYDSSFLNNINDGVSSNIIIMPSNNKKHKNSLFKGDSENVNDFFRVFTGDNILIKSENNSLVSYPIMNISEETRGTENRDKESQIRRNLQVNKLEIERDSTKLGFTPIQDSFYKLKSEDDFNISEKKNSSIQYNENNQSNTISLNDNLKDIKKSFRTFVSRDKVIRPVKMNYKSHQNIVKGHKISNTTLCLSSEISDVISIDTFNSIIDSSSKIKIYKDIYERIAIPQFRSVIMNKLNNNSKLIDVNKSGIINDYSVVNKNKWVIMFILSLFLVFIVIIIYVICK